MRYETEWQFALSAVDRAWCVALTPRLGGFVTPRVVAFYHHYLASVFAQSKGLRGADHL